MLGHVLPLLLDKSRFLITTHVRPDGDAVGSQLALGLFLEKLGKQVTLLNSDAPPDNLAWLPGADRIDVFDGSLGQHQHLAEADALLVVDTNTEDRLGKMGGAVKNSSAIKVLIDHHTDPESWFDYMYVRDTASSTGELIHELISAHDPDLIDTPIATALYTAILTDTGSFRFSNVTPSVHRVIADLLERGGLEPDRIYTALYEMRTQGGLRLLSMVLDTLVLHFDQRLSHMVISQRMLKETGATHEDTEGLINYGLTLEGVQVALLFTETPSGTKVSFRSKGDWHVNGWARAFGGGGHRNASGAFVRESLEAVIDKVVASAPRYLALPEEAPSQQDTLSPEDADYLSALLDIKAQQTQ